MTPALGTDARVAWDRSVRGGPCASRDVEPARRICPAVRLFPGRRRTGGCLLCSVMTAFCLASLSVAAVGGSLVCASVYNLFFAEEPRAALQSVSRKSPEPTSEASFDAVAAAAAEPRADAANIAAADRAVSVKAYEFADFDAELSA